MEPGNTVERSQSKTPEKSAFKKIKDIVHPHTKKPLIDDERKTVDDKKKISELTREIKNLPEPKEESQKIETPKTPEKPIAPEFQLFPPVKTRFDKYHKIYEKEKKTLRGFLNRRKNIHLLENQGIKGAEKFYDDMRSRGFGSSFIKNISSWRDPTVDLLNLGSTIDRSNLVGLDIDPFNGFSLIDYSFIKDIQSLTDQQFNEKVNQFNQYFFIKRFKKEHQEFCYSSNGSFDISSDNHDYYLDHGNNGYFSSAYFTERIFNKDYSLSEESKHILDSLKEIYITNTESDEVNIFAANFLLNETRRKPLNKDVFSESIRDSFINNLMYKKINNPITIPEIVNEVVTDRYKSLFDRVNSLNDQNQQEFCLRRDYSLSDNTDPLFKDNLPLPEFYLNYYSSLSEYDKAYYSKVSIPENILDSFNDSDQKKWKSIINFNNSEYQRYAIQLLNISPDNPAYLAVFNENGNPTLDFFTKFFKNNQNTNKFTELFEEINTKHFPNFSLKDQIVWNHVFKLNNIYLSQFLLIDINYLDQKNNLSCIFFRDAFLNAKKDEDRNFILEKVRSDYLVFFDPEEQIIWKDIFNLNRTEYQNYYINYINHKGYSNRIFDENNQPTIKFFTEYAKELSTRSDSSKIDNLYNDIQKIDNKFSRIDFLNLLKKENLIVLNDYLIKHGDKNDWEIIFGKQLINDLFSSLPIKTDEKRNAFTHNEYDRTSKFFEFLIDHQYDFSLNNENLKLVTEYIQNFGMAKSDIIFTYFRTLKLFEQGLKSLPPDLISNKIESVKDLKIQVNKVKKMCFSQKSITNLQELNSFQQGLLSIVTGHAINRWTRIPIENIISDFSNDIVNGRIKPLPKDFHPETISSETIKIETDKKITDSSKLASLSQEILSAIGNINSIDSEKDILSQMFNQRLSSLLKDMASADPQKPKKQEFIQKQINSFKDELELISKSTNIDNFLVNLISFNLNLGDDQEKYNSILRQLVFKKVFLKHQDSPQWQEKIKVSLETNSTVDGINNMTDLINNTIKDHALNFESNNQDNYWDESTFEIMKKYSSVFKKNLSFPSFVNELNFYRESFTITELNKNQTIQITPDRGLIGEMSGYMADVCYTKVYPLLRQYQDLIPYKFISNPESDSPEFIGSTLVFKVESKENEPLFLIRAFDIPNEQSFNIGNFFESFVDKLVPIAKKMGIKKIIAAGTSGTISNYSGTTNYVIDKYVKDKVPTQLNQTFDFNGYNITNQCYLVRDLT